MKAAKAGRAACSRWSDKKQAKLTEREARRFCHPVIVIFLMTSEERARETRPTKLWLSPCSGYLQRTRKRCDEGRPFSLHNEGTIASRHVISAYLPSNPRVFRKWTQAKQHAEIGPLRPWNKSGMTAPRPRFCESSFGCTTSHVVAGRQHSDGLESNILIVVAFWVSSYFREHGDVGDEKVVITKAADTSYQHVPFWFMCHRRNCLSRRHVNCIVR